MAKKDETATPPATPEPQPATPPAEDPRFKTLEETISKQGETIGQLQEYVGLSSTLINTIAADPDLSQRVRSAISGQPGIPPQQPGQGNPPAQNNNQPAGPSQEVMGKVDDVVSSQRESILKDFEHTYGIDQLPREQQTKTKQAIASYLGDFGWEVSKIPLTNLRASLDKAYMGAVGLEKLKEEGKLEGFVQARQNDWGAIGTFGGGAPSPDQTGNLSPRQAEWIQKLRVDPDKAKKTYNERTNEQDREKTV